MSLQSVVPIEELLASRSDDEIATITGLTLEEIIGLRAMRAAGPSRADAHWRQAITDLAGPMRRPQ